MARKHDRAEGTGARLERSRRGLLAGAAGALGVLAAETVVTAQPAAATQGKPVILGKDNTGATSRTGIIATGQADGVFGQGSGTGTGVVGAGGSSNGVGVQGTGGFGGGSGVVGGGGAGGGVFGVGAPTKGIGVTGAGGGAGTSVLGVGGFAGGDGIKGRAMSAAGAGMLAESAVGGTALRVSGSAEFSRSGVLTVAAGSSSATQTGIALTAASLVLATLQQDVAGVWVRSAVPNVTAKSFTVHLSKAVSATAKVAWFVVN